MNALLPACGAAVLLLIGASVSALLPRAEARWVCVVQAAFASAAAIVAALIFIEDPRTLDLVVGPARLTLDALAASLLPPITLTALALSLSWARGTDGAPVFVQVAAGLASLSVMAGDPLTLGAVELMAMLTTMLHVPRHAGRVILVFHGLAMLLLGATLVHVMQADPAVLSSWAAVTAVTGPNELIALLGAAALVIGVAPTAPVVTATLARGFSPSALVTIAPYTGFAIVARWIEPAIRQSHHAVGDAVAPGLVALAVVAAALTVVQRSMRRALSWTLLAMQSLVFAALLDMTDTGFLGGELMWMALLPSTVGLSIAFSLATRRTGELDLRSHHGVFDSVPTLGVLFLLFVVAVSGLPGTLEFASAEVVLHGGVTHQVLALLAAAATMSLVGFGSLRVFMRVFLGPPSADWPPMPLRLGETVALVGLLGILVVGGVAPSLIPLVSRKVASRADHAASTPGPKERVHGKKRTDAPPSFERTGLNTSENQSRGLRVRVGDRVAVAVVVDGPRLGRRLGGGEVEVNADRCVVADALPGFGQRVCPSKRGCGLRVAEQVVDAPAAVNGADLLPGPPPRIRPIHIADVLALQVYPTAREQLVEEFALLRQEA